MNRAMSMMSSKANDDQYVASESQIAVVAGRMIDSGYLPYDKDSFTKLSAWLTLFKLNKTKKGIMLTGNTGTGKTMFLRKFIGKPTTAADVVEMRQNLSHSSFRAELYREHRDDFIYVKPSGCVIDDIGQERVSMSFGNKEEVMETVICELYRIWQDGSKSHFSTNLNIQQLSKRYGMRVVDRLMEMCHIIEMKGVSARQ
jgi:DNA replication protein DnaC